MKKRMEEKNQLKADPGASREMHVIADTLPAFHNINAGRTPEAPLGTIFSNGLALHRAGRLNEAEAQYRSILVRNPEHFDALSMLGAICVQRGNFEEALRLINRSLRINPRQPAALNNRAFALKELKLYADALASCDEAIALKPESAEGYYNRGVVLKELKRFEEALVSYDRAIALRPGHAEAFYNRGAVLKELKRLEEALASYDRAIALRPGHAEAFNNRGIVLKDLGRFEEALASYDRAIALRPDYASAHWNKGLAKLTLGDFEEGWRQYEWRWKMDNFPSPKRGFSEPIWLGEESLGGRTVLLHAEQGLGDTIQFCRYAGLAAGLGASVILEVQPQLESLLASQGWNVQVIAQGAAIPPFDLHCPLLSLPLAFKTRLDTVPAGIPYLKARPADIERWIERLGERKKPRVGIAWAGNQTYKNDRNRSIPLEKLKPLARFDIEPICLQKDLRPADEAVLENTLHIGSLGEELKDFSDTAALVSLLDLVIAVDTAVAHLAGAMGKPAWILLPFIETDWRWLVDREDNPWYPTARLFRQPEIDDWESVISKIDRELEALFGTAD